MSLFAWGVVAVAICLCVYALNEHLKKGENIRKDAEESMDKILKKPSADVINPEQVVMAEKRKDEMEAHEINKQVDDIKEAQRLSNIDN